MTDAEEMVELMRYASPSKVAKALGVSKASTGAWAKGRNVTPYRVRQVHDLLRPEQGESAPQWVERLLAGVMALEGKTGVSDAELARAQARAAAALAVAPPTRPRPTGGGAQAPSAA